MAGVSPAGPQQFPTPSPFSVVSPRHSSRPPTQIPNLFLRLLSLVLAFTAALSLAFMYRYCFVISILVFVYSAYQLFKGVCDISHRGIAIPDKVSDYLSFILDQLVAYLVISSASVGIQGIQNTHRGSPLWKAAVISVIMSFVIFSVIATCALLSGYKLCKRIIW